MYKFRGRIVENGIGKTTDYVSDLSQMSKKRTPWKMCQHTVVRQIPVSSVFGSLLEQRSVIGIPNQECPRYPRPQFPPPTQQGDYSPVWADLVHAHDYTAA